MFTCCGAKRLARLVSEDPIKLDTYRVNRWFPAD